MIEAVKEKTKWYNIEKSRGDFPLSERESKGSAKSNEMIFKILADIVVLTHFLWILFLFFGAFLGRRNRTLKIFHLSGLLFALFIQIFDWYCPLTHLEIWLRSKHDPGLIYAGSFIIHYVERLVYIELSRLFIFGFTIFLFGFNAWFYLKKKK